MSEESKNTEEKECKCFCKSKEFKNFLTIALGSFVGVYAALSLFTAMHRPPVMPCPYRGGFGAPAPVAAPCPFAHHHFDKHRVKGEFHKEFKGDKTPAPFDKERDKD